MKLRSLFIAFLASLALLVSGCVQEKLEEPLTRNYETFVGEFKSLGGIRVNDQITHLFEKEDGTILYAYSDRYNLDDEAYFEIIVEAYGVVMSFEDLDKEVFEVRRITEAPEEEEIDETVTMVEYKDPVLGFSISYPNDWTLTALRDSVTLEAPGTETPAAEETTEETPMEPDYIVIAQTAASLTKTSEDPEEDRLSEVQSFIGANYELLTGVSSEVSYIGTDRQWAVRYKTEEGRIIAYFVPRGSELFEISFFHPAQEEGDRIANTNTFSSIVASFRFLPFGIEETEETAEEESTEEEVEAVEEVEEEKEPLESSSTEQISFSSYRELQSNPFKFKISYPGSWYYSGDNSGYSFDDAPIENDLDAILRLDMNKSTTEGTSRSGTQVSLTVKVDDRFYTLTGPEEYETVMQSMLDSIQTIE